jgi:hypothetical protein
MENQNNEKKKQELDDIEESVNDTVEETTETDSAQDDITPDKKKPVYSHDQLTAILAAQKKKAVENDPKTQELEEKLKTLEKEKEEAEAAAKEAEQRGRMSVKIEAACKEFGLTEDMFPSDEEKFNDMCSRLRANAESRTKVIPMQAQKPSSLVGW